MPMRLVFAARGKKKDPPRLGDDAATGKPPRGEKNWCATYRRYRREVREAAMRWERARHESAMSPRLGRRSGDKRM
jgi:hypothetical protein